MSESHFSIDEFATVMRAGYSIGLSANGSTVVFGAPGETANQGCAFVFAFNGSGYSMLGTRLVFSQFSLLFPALGKEQRKTKEKKKKGVKKKSQ